MTVEPDGSGGGQPAGSTGQPKGESSLAEGSDELAEPSAPFLGFERINKFFGAHHVIQDFSLEVHAGEILALVGPSGSGKTTLLRLLAGFEKVDLGRLLLDGEDITDLPPARRGFGMVFQSYALFPHLSVGENVAFGLEALSRIDRQEIGPRVSALLESLDLAGFERRRVHEISGGQQQRVALARALAPEPRLLMLDEPLSNLDPTLRERTRRELRKTLKSTGVTTVLVTHEQEEAFELGDRVGVLRAGRLEQVGPPRALYESPATRFVATFVGRSALLQGVIETIDRGHCRVCLLGGDVSVERAYLSALAADSLAIGDAVEVAVRPESWELTAPGIADSFAGTIRACRYLGPSTYYMVVLDLGPEVEVLAPSPDLAIDSRVGLRVSQPAPGRPPARAFIRERAERP